MRAWLKWLERDKMKKQARKERLEKQEEISRRWKLPKEGQKIVKENHSNWQDRKRTEEENKMILEIEEERIARLEKAKSKEEKYKIKKELETKEKMVQRKLILAEIKENSWKRRCDKSSHEEYTERAEKEKEKRKRKM